MHFGEFKAKVVALVNEKPLSKRENEEITESLISLLKIANPEWASYLIFHCINSGCFYRISEACKSINEVSIAPFLFDQSKDLVETLICCPIFLEEFVYISLDRQTEEKSRPLWDFIATLESEQILNLQSLSLVRLELFRRLENVELIESYLRDLLRSQKYDISNLELEILWALAPQNSLLIEIALLRRMKLKRRINLKKMPISANLLYLAILNNSILNDEEIEYILDYGEDLIKCLFSILVILNYPQGKHYYERIRKIIFNEGFSEFSLDFDFISLEFRLIKSTLEQNAFDVKLHYPKYLIDYVFVKIQMNMILHDAFDDFFNFLIYYPHFFDHGFTIFRISKPSSFVSESLIQLSSVDNHISNEIRFYLENYSKSEKNLLIVSKYNSVPDMLKVVKSEFESIKDVQLRAEIMFNLVSEEKASQSSLEMCLHALVKDISTGKNRQAWAIYLKIMRKMVDVGLISPIVAWELFREIKIEADLIPEFFSVLEDLCLVPLIDLGEEGEDFDESIKDSVNFLVNSLQDRTSSPFAFKAICAFPGPIIKKLIPHFDVDLFERVISNKVSIESLAKYTMIELNGSMPRSLLLGTSDSSTFNNQYVDLSWFRPKKCSFSWFSETKNVLTFPPIISIPFVLRKLIMIYAINWYLDHFSKQANPKMIESNSILCQTCAGIAFNRLTGSGGKFLTSQQSSLQKDLNTKNEEYLAQILLCLQFIRKELNDQEKIIYPSGKFLDPTINLHIEELNGELSPIKPDEETVSKGLYYYNLGREIENAKFVDLSRELLAQPASTGLINALSLAISRGISVPLERNEVEMILSKIPESAFRQSRFGIWIDAFYFSVQLSSSGFFKKNNLPTEVSYRRIPEDYLVRILFDHIGRCAGVQDVLINCDFLPRIDWHEITESLSNQLVMKHLVSKTARDNQFVSPSLLALANKAYCTQFLDFFLIQNLDSYLNATDLKNINNLLLSLDFNRYDQNSIKLLIQKSYDLNVSISFLKTIFTFVSQNPPLLELLGEFKEDYGDSSAKKVYDLMAKPWETSQLESYLCDLDKNTFISIFNLKYLKFPHELIDVFLICCKLQRTDLAQAVLAKYCPIENCSFDIKLDWLSMVTQDGSKINRLKKMYNLSMEDMQCKEQ